MGSTKRPQNKCKSCGYTWYPRGKNLSSKCPNCGSQDVSIKWSWGGLAAVVIIGGALFSGGDDKPKDAATDIASKQSLSQQLEVTEVLAPIPDSKRESVPLPDDANASIIHKVETEAHPESLHLSAHQKLNTPLTPTTICASESNIFSRNNCEWRECAKPEFTDLAECIHKKPKEELLGG